MVAQLVKNELGVYEYQEVDTKPKVVSPNLSEFEAYEGQKQKTELVSAPTISEQTERVIRETPGQYRTEFDEKTGQFTTKEISPTEGRAITYTPGAVTPESTEPTALEKVMKMTEGRTVEEPDYRQIISDAARAARPTFKEQALSTALNVGGNVLSSYITKKMTGAAGDFVINNMTQHVLGKTMAGRLATGGMLTGTTINPYVAAGSLLMDKKVGKKVVKTVKKAAKSVADFFSGGTVICTELYKQKLMSKEDCRLSWNFTVNNFSSTHINGYWYWAVPMVKIMKKNKLVTKLWNHIMSNRTKDIKWRLHKGRFNLLGRLYSILIENGSYTVGKLIKKKKTNEVLV